jgi:hypothetical protein
LATTYRFLPDERGLDQEYDPWDVRVIHRVHRLQVQSLGIGFKSRERLVHSECVGVIGMGVDD